MFGTHDNTTADSVPVAESGSSDGPLSRDALKSAEETLEVARLEWRASVERARKDLKDAVSAHENEVARARKDLEEAAKPRTLASLGALKKVTITETSITTPSGTFPLTEGISAVADEKGMKQVVQGWVFKSNQDRREVYLHISGPGWADVVAYNIQYSILQPEQIYNFALQINGASAYASLHNAAVTRRTALAEQRLAQQLQAWTSVTEEAKALAQTAGETASVRQRQVELRRLLDSLATSEDRHTRKARRRVAKPIKNWNAVALKLQPKPKWQLPA